jgi:hypothetical protein
MYADHVAPRRPPPRKLEELEELGARLVVSLAPEVL